MDGGSKYITLTSDNIPPHNHEIASYQSGQTNDTEAGGMYCLNASTLWAYSMKGNEANAKATNNNTGAAQAINITYRYTTCYFWRRVS